MTLLYGTLQLCVCQATYGGRRPEPDTQILRTRRFDEIFFDGDVNNHGDILNTTDSEFEQDSTCVFLPTVATIFRRTGVTWAHFQCYLDDKYVEGFSTFLLAQWRFFFDKKKKWKICLKYQHFEKEIHNFFHNFWYLSSYLSTIISTSNLWSVEIQELKCKFKTRY